MKQTYKPVGVFLIGIFLIIAVIIIEVAGISLLFPDIFFAKIWALNPTAYKQIAPFKLFAGLGFTILGAVFIFADMGWFKRRKWGWRLVTAIFFINGIGDGINLLKGDVLGGAVGLTIAAMLLVYLTRPKIKSLFAA